VIADVGDGIADPAAARDISSAVSISAGGFRREPKTGLDVQLVSIRNTSTLPIALPLSLMITGLPEGVLLENKIGKTKAIAPLGSVLAGVELPEDEDFLAPGSVATTTLKFSNRGGRPIAYQSKLVYGIRP
jgi:hypothetical protein